MKFVLAFFLAAFAAPVMAADKSNDATVYEPMAAFAKLAGRTWRGEGVGPNGQPIVDIARYEMILGGRGFQSTHKLEGGTYGGRTIFFYDEAAKEYIFHYFTTAGFHTTGTIEPTKTGFAAVETVNGHKEFAEVRSEIFIEGDRLRVVSSHITHDGKASPGDTLIYKEIDPSGVLLFDEADALSSKRTSVKDANDRHGND